MIKAFARAVLAGTLAGTMVPVMILAVLMLGSAPSSADIGGIVRIVILAVAIPLSLVGVSAAALGIPATLALRAAGWESEAAYLFVGTVLGFIVPTVVTAAFFGSGAFTPLSLLGAFSGFVTARSWWRGYRQHAVVDAD
jgi:hypothetical protein